MTESDARKILIVRAVERSDPKGVALPFEARMDAAREGGGTELLEGGALEVSQNEALTSQEAEFLAKRARKLEERLRQKGALPKGADSKGIPGWLGPVLITAVLILGFFSTNLGREGAELNILALPLLGILAWNLAVYILAIIGLLTGASGRRSGILTSMAEKIGKMGKGKDKEGGKVQNGRDGTKLGASDEWRLAAEWFEEKLPVHSSRLGTILHLAAAALAVGGVAGLFYQGWSVEYVAVWESTLFSADSLGRFFGFLFSSASWVSGIEIPLETLSEIQRGVGLEHRGGDALPWLQLYAVTMGIFVVVPRLIFAAIYRWHTAKLRADFPLSASLRPYLSEVLRGLKGESQIAEIVSYAYSPEPRVRDAGGLLHELWGGGIFPEFGKPIDYGDEEDYLDKPSDDPKYTVLLMNFSTTPEDEAHGFLGKALRERIAADPDAGNPQKNGGRSLLVLLDGSGFSKRFGELPEFARRVDERRAAWGRVMDRSGLSVATIHLPGEGTAGRVAEVSRQIWNTSEHATVNAVTGHDGN